MAYVTPVTNHTPASFFNVADWVRIYGNLLEVNTAINAALGLGIRFDTQTTVTDTDIPTTDTSLPINPVLANIERVRYALRNSSIPTDNPDFIEIKDDWLPGQSNAAPNFTHVNSWEKVTDIIYQIYKSPYSPDRLPVTGVANCGAELLRNSLIR